VVRDAAVKITKSYTLIELIIAIVILGILAFTVVPRFIELSNREAESDARGALVIMRAAVAAQFAKNAAKGNPVFPPSIKAEYFADGKIPKEAFSKSDKITYATSAPTGEGIGWRYDKLNGRVWINHYQYSDY
jgi:prepilin-type N-terminal cleavage/methylation domain-containing protein